MGERAPSQRAAAKEISRRKILASAKSLFTEKGYDGATIREIAAGAGVSTGAVFNSFTDKYEVFAQIVETDRKTLWDAMRAAARGETIDETIWLMFDAGCAAALPNLKLMQSAVGLPWSDALAAELKDRIARWSIEGLLATVLSEAIARCELVREINVPLVSEMLADCFVANFKGAAFSGWGRRELRARLAEQTALLLGRQKSGAVSSFINGPSVPLRQLRSRAR
jgi:AcrR family transcriptional regulator